MVEEGQIKFNLQPWELSRATTTRVAGNTVRTTSGRMFVTGYSVTKTLLSCASEIAWTINLFQAISLRIA